MTVLLSWYDEGEKWQYITLTQEELDTIIAKYGGCENG